MTEIEIERRAKWVNTLLFVKNDSRREIDRCGDAGVRALTCGLSCLNTLSALLAKPLVIVDIGRLRRKERLAEADDMPTLGLQHSHNEICSSVAGECGPGQMTSWG